MSFSRRNIAAWLAGGIAVFGAAVWRFSPLFGPRYPPTPYDDLLARLIDREEATHLGVAALAGMPGFQPKKEAAALRHRIGARSLAVVAGQDALEGRLSNIAGWLVPESVARLSALAAASKPVAPG